jgi:hypothetical protein
MSNIIQKVKISQEKLIVNYRYNFFYTVAVTIMLGYFCKLFKWQIFFLVLKQKVMDNFWKIFFIFVLFCCEE